MSFDRYLGVTKSFASKDWMSRLRTIRTAYIISIIAWIISILCSIQLFLYSTVTECGRCEHNFPAVSCTFYSQMLLVLMEEKVTRELMMLIDLITSIVHHNKQIVDPRALTNVFRLFTK